MATTPAMGIADEALAAATTDLHLDTARALTRLPYAFGDQFQPGHPRNALISHLTRDLVCAGFAIHDCDARERTGGVCLTPTESEPVGVIVTWTTHTAMGLDPDRWDVQTDLALLMHFVLDDVLCALGWESEPLGDNGARVVTGRLTTVSDSSVGR